MKKPTRPILAIGGLDPSGHAGLLADARVFENLNVDYRIAVTAITAQSEKKFFSWQPVELKLFQAQLDAAGPKLAGVKIGMLGTVAHLKAVAACLKKYSPTWVVWDPVWRSSTGAQLFRGKPADLLKLLPYVDIWTPNLPEAELFLSKPFGPPNEIRSAARDLWELGGKKRRVVVLKGGHSQERRWATDILADASKISLLQGKRFTGSRRGTGCTFASAVLAALVTGKNPVESARFAKSYVKRKLFSLHRRS